MDTQLPISELPKLPKRKRGPKPLPVEDVRLITVSVRLNPAEIAELDSARKLVQMRRGTYLRSASRGVLPPSIPAINREAWSSLSNVCGNLNQYQAAINQGTATGYPTSVIQELHDQVQRLRKDLICIR
jgi:hypothetical protein